MEPSFVPERSATLGACKTGLIILPKAHRHVVWVLYDQKKSCATFFFNRLLCTRFLFMHNTSFLVETRSFSGIPALGKGEYTQFHTFLQLRMFAPSRENHWGIPASLPRETLRWRQNPIVPILTLCTTYTITKEHKAATPKHTPTVWLRSRARVSLQNRSKSRRTANMNLKNHAR